MQIIETIGNRELLEREKTLFLCSKRTPIELYEYVFRWVDGLTKRDCVACFNSTEMEAEVVKALLVAKIPTVLFVMNRFTDVYNMQIERALQEKRTLIVVLKRDEPKGKGLTPRLRNEYVLSMVQHVVCGYVNKNGSVFPILAGRQNVKRLIDDEVYAIAAETEIRRERWTVSQDKVLLRMFYEDMGIHAIHKQLHRSYLSIYQRTHTITMPEELLKGREFEDFVLELFNIREDGVFILKEWQGDKTLGEVCPESNRHPDFVFACKDGIFAVECKWREHIGRNLEKDLFPTDRMAIYQQFADERKIPVFFVLGVGGEPCQPEQFYLIPLQELPNVLSNQLLITDFLRIPIDKPFAVKDFVKRKEQKAYSIEEKRKKHPNAYKSWSKEDDELLMQMYSSGRTIKELSELFKRGIGAISSRIKKL
ncbi:MAG: hypothetical protein IKQ03_09630 [Prevotella sp.]|jgi:hypothetical protein|nr:hypothetical protein [Prevotella sp.]